MAERDKNRALDHLCPCQKMKALWLGITAGKER
jgi:hypothetical protein